MSVTADNPVFRATPNSSFVYAKNWNLQLVNRGRINAQGFVHDADYDAEATTPLMAIFGDSYVEALMVPFPDTITGRLGAQVKDNGRIYDFSFSGAPLSQYLAWASYVRDSYKPDAATFVIISNDFDESLMKYRSARGFQYFVEEEDGSLRLQSVQTENHLFRRFAKKSALMRYLVFQLHLTTLPGKVKAMLNPPQQDQAEAVFENNAAYTVTPERLSDSKKAVVTFLDRVAEASGLPADKILFVVDGLRERIYEGKAAEASNSYAGQMFRFFIAEAKKRGFNLIDLQAVFAEDYRKNGRKFEFDIDAHWSGYGHKVAAEAVADTSLFSDIFGQ